MALLHWRDNLSVGVDDVDADHKHLIDLLNELHYLVFAGGDRTSVGKVLEKLVRYTEYHFDREEKLMRVARLPRIGGAPDPSPGFGAAAIRVPKVFRGPPRVLRFAGIL